MCRKCRLDKRTERHAPDGKRITDLPLKREHGTLRGCRQHWARGGDLSKCDSCREFYEALVAERELEEELAQIAKKREKEEMKKRRQMMPTVMTSVRLTVSSVEEMERIAEEDGISRNAVIQRAVDAYGIMR